MNTVPPISTSKEKTRVASPKGVTTLMYACQQGDVEKVRRILRVQPETISKVDRSGKTALHYCCTSDNKCAAQAADLLVMAAPDLLDSRDEDGFTPLHLAVIAGNMPLVTFLLANNADINAVDSEKHTVVHWATVCGETGALRAVLAAGAPVSTPDVHGGYPLHYAAQMCGGDKDSTLGIQVLQALLQHREIKVDVEDGDGRQPLLWAASAGSTKAVLALIRAGSTVNAPDKDGLTALHCAASRGHTDCIDTLLTLCGMSPDVIDSNGCTALHYSVTLGHADATALLLTHGADPNRQDRKGRSPAHCGCAKGQFETVKMIGSHGANLWLRNARGDFPLHEAAASGRRDLVKWLLEARPSQVNARNNDGRCPLHLAALNDNSDMCKILLDAGAQINPVLRTSKNNFMTPLDCALQRGFRSTAKYLQVHGGVPSIRLSTSKMKLPNGTANVHIREEVTFGETTDSEREGEEKEEHVKKRHRKKLSYKYEKKKTFSSSKEDEDQEIKASSSDLKREKSAKRKSSGEKQSGNDRKFKENVTYSSEVKITNNYGGINIEKNGEIIISDGSPIVTTKKSKTSKEVDDARLPEIVKEPIQIHNDTNNNNQTKPNESTPTKTLTINENIEEIKTLANTIEKTAKSITEEAIQIQEKLDVEDATKMKQQDQISYTSADESEHKELIVEAAVHHPPKSPLIDNVRLKEIETKRTEELEAKKQELEKQKQALEEQKLEIKEQKLEIEGQKEELKEQKEELKEKKLELKEQEEMLKQQERELELLKEEMEKGNIEVEKEVEVNKEKEMASIEDEAQKAETEEFYVEKESVQDVEVSSEIKQGDEETNDEQKGDGNEEGKGEENGEEKDDEKEEELKEEENEEDEQEGLESNELIEISNQHTELEASDTEKENKIDEQNDEKLQDIEVEKNDEADVDNSAIKEETSDISISTADTIKLAEKVSILENIEPKEASKDTIDQNDNLQDDLSAKMVEEVIKDDSAIKKDENDDVQKETEGVTAVGMESKDKNGKHKKFLKEKKQRKVSETPRTTPKEKTKPLDSVRDKKVKSVKKDKPKDSTKTRKEEISKKIPKKAIEKILEVTNQELEETKTVKIHKNGTKSIPKSKQIKKNNKEYSEEHSSAEESTSSDTEKRKHKSFTVLDEVKIAEDKKKTKIPIFNLRKDLSKSDRYLDRCGENDLDKISLPNLPRENGLNQIRKITSAYSDNDRTPSDIEDGTPTARRRRLRKRMNRDSRSAGSDYESSNLMDSGFEPSPRSTKIPRWKNMTERGVNMSSVTQTIQSNIRRYHLERKIFQHLLELKRLQIRSGQHNEAVLVKRAIDEYHNSCASTVGAGRYVPEDYSFKSFEKFLYLGLRKLQKSDMEHLRGLPEMPDNPLLCTQSTHRCLHATHAYTGIPCAAYLPKMDHHTIPKIGYSCKPQGFLPHIHPKKTVTLELLHGNDKQVISLPTDRLDQNKRYYVTFTVKGQETTSPSSGVQGREDPHRHAKSV
nr:ankyrin repeat domain-containing protein 12 [Onthophagus taurus]